MRAIALLSWWQVRNSLRTLVTDPKKAIPALVFAVIIAVQLFAYASIGGGHGARGVSPLLKIVRDNAAESHAIIFGLFALGSLMMLANGFSGKVLVFPLADIDYLFPSPVSRRTVLAWRLPGIMAQKGWSALALVYVAYAVLRGSESASVAGWILFLGSLLWMAAYTNLAIAAEVVFGLGKAKVARRVIEGLMLLIAASAAFMIWRYGLTGITALERNAVFAVLFYPCRLLADAMLAALSGSGAGSAMWQLALFYVLTLALVLTRHENYYEATLEVSERVATVRKAMREGNAFAAFSLFRSGRDKPAKDFDRAYALKPFGRGAMAVLWAHLTALAKRPWVHFAAPFAMGLAFALGAMLWQPEAAPIIVGIAAGYVIYIGQVIAGRATFRTSVQRVPLMRPLPIAPIKIVATEVAPPVLQGTLAAWGAALPLLAGNDAARLVSGLLLLAAPPVMACALLLTGAVTFWYPDASDKTAQLLSGLVMMVLLALVALVLTPFIVVPLALRLPGLLLLSVPVGALAAGTALLFLATRAYTRIEA
jgi:hypothetical protein